MTTSQLEQQMIEKYENEYRLFIRLTEDENLYKVVAIGSLEHCENTTKLYAGKAMILVKTYNIIK